MGSSIVFTRTTTKTKTIAIIEHSDFFLCVNYFFLNIEISGINSVYQQQNQRIIFVIFGSGRIGGAEAVMGSSEKEAVAGHTHKHKNFKTSSNPKVESLKSGFCSSKKSFS